MAGRNEIAIKQYFQNQIKEDNGYDQFTLKEYADPFTGGKN